MIPRVALGPIDRRRFLAAGSAAGAGLVVGFYIPTRGEAEAAAPPGPFQPNAWLQITAAGQVTIWLGKSEMGQGVKTALPSIVAEELDCDWTKVKVEHADFDPKYGSQGTGGSSSVHESYEPLRKAGAAAREMLAAAAAAAWGVDRAACATGNGAVVHAGSGRRLSYGELAEKASALPVPEAPPLKDPKDFKIIGRRTPRVDTPDKAAGRAVFGIDVTVPGMLYAAVARCPVFGGKVASFDDAKAKAVAGVRRVVPIKSGVAVVADSTWSAFEGRRALAVTWDEGPNAALTSDAIRKQWAEAVSKPAPAARSDGDVAAALASAARKVEAVYELPFLNHAPMEPQNATADVRADRCEVWAATQFPGTAHDVAKEITGLPPEKITVHVTLLGGAFGRRIDADYVADAVEVSKQVGAPVKVVWSRDDDMHHDWFRPGSHHRLEAGLDKEGKLVAWMHRVAGPSIRGQRGPLQGEYDRSMVSGAANLPYAVPNVRVEAAMSNTAVPTGWWRSVYDSQTAFANECFLDEVAAAAGKDPYEMRRSLLAGSPRHLGVLDLAAAKAGWGKPPGAGVSRGIAVHFSFRSWTAMVAEVSVGRDGKPRVHRVVGAIDCGTVVNPDIVEAQIEGGIVYGLTALLYGEITLDKGRVQQNNFDTYELLRLHEMPKVEVHIVPSTEPPTGTGEPSVPTIAPAVANAVFAATGKRIRRLPVRAADLRTA